MNEILAASTLVLALTNGILLWISGRERRFFMDQIQLLVNKAMSPSYQAFAQAENPAPKVQIPPDVPDDLRSLQEFKLGV